jgi:hypothetical protein
VTTALVAGLALVTGLLAVLVAGLLRSHAEIIRALHEAGVTVDPDAVAVDDAHDHGAVPSAVPVLGRSRPATGGPALADVNGTSPLGGAVHVAVEGTRRRTLLAFLSTTCTTCRGFWKTFSEVELAVPGQARLVVVVRDPDAESPSELAKLMAPHITTVQSSQAWADYQVPGAPYFVLVDGAAGKVVGEGTATSWQHVTNLLEQALGDVMHRNQAEREAHVDAQLKAAGIEPGDPSLYPGQVG